MYASSVEQIVERQTLTTTEESRVKYLGSARARLGWGGPWLLLYGTAGLAWEQLERTNTRTSTNRALRKIAPSPDLCESDV